jgi:class 3 adenylate cyclase
MSTPPGSAVATVLVSRAYGARAAFLEIFARLLPQRLGGERLLNEIEQLLAGERPRRLPDQILATVLFTDIVESTTRVAKIGDRRWRRILEAHDHSVRSHVAEHGGRVLKSMGDGYLATFERPAGAIRCGRAMRHDAKSLGLQVKVGIHTGECERIGNDVAGLAVHIGARVMAKASPGEVLATSVVRDLVVGSGIKFAERGAHELRGVPGVWTLHAVAV